MPSLRLVEPFVGQMARSRADDVQQTAYEGRTALACALGNQSEAGMAWKSLATARVSWSVGSFAWAAWMSPGVRGPKGNTQLLHGQGSMRKPTELASSNAGTEIFYGSRIDFPIEMFVGNKAYFEADGVQNGICWSWCTEWSLLVMLYIFGGSLQRVR